MRRLVRHVGSELTVDVAENRLVPMQNHGVKTMSMGYLLREWERSGQGDQPPPELAPPSAPSANNDNPVVWRGLMVMKAVQQVGRCREAVRVYWLITT